MLGNILIPYHTNRYAKKNVRRFSSSFDEASTFGILCSYKSLIDGDRLVEAYVEELKSKGKKVTLLVFHENSSRTDNNSFSKRDLNFFGFWKKDKVNAFTAKTFDFLIYLDLDYNLFVANVLAKSHAHCRIGIYESESSPYLELMIKPEERTLGSLINSLNLMLEKIRHEE